jgi:tyrocidine synthetase III
MSISDKTAQLTPEQRKQLEKKLLSGQRKYSATETDRRIPKVELFPNYPLSNAQRRLWILSQFEGGLGAYNMPGAYWLEGELDEAGFGWAFEQLLERHESLRTAIEEAEGEPVQKIRSAAELDFKVIYKDWKGSEGELEELIAGEAKCGFDLSEAPLLRVKVLRVEEHRRLLLFTMHHIVSDGWSMGVLVRDVAKLYEGYMAGKRSQEEVLEPLRVHYKDYTSWQRGRLEGEKGASDLAYWKEKLAEGALEPLDLPTDRQRGKTKTYRGAGVSRTYPKELLAGLQGIARQEDCTLFMVLMAVTKVLLRRYTNRDEIVVGTGIAGRNHPDLQDQIGFYVNTLVLRDDLKLNEEFNKVLAKVKQTLVEAYAHGEYPFDRLVEELPDLERDVSRNPLFEVLVMMTENWAIGSGGKLGLAGVVITGVERKGERTAKFDWMITFGESEKGLSIDIEYNNNLYEEWRMESLLAHFSHLVESIIKDTTQEIGKLKLIGEEEKHRLLIDFNNTKSEYPSEKTIIELFEEQVDRTPSKVAVICEERELSYQLLNERANQLARYLRNKYNLKKGSLVGILMDRSENIFIAMYAILKIGAVYVPINRDFGSNRIKSILQLYNITLIISDNLDEYFENIRCVKFSRNEYGHPWCKYSVKNCDETITLKDPFYVIFTSGSTGRPKGIVVQHRVIINALRDLQKLCPTNSKSCWLFKTSVAFDVSITEIFGWILGGGAVAVLKSGGERDPEAIRAACRRWNITHINFVPSMVEEFVAECDFVGCNFLMLAGEKLTRSQLTKVHERNKYIKCYNIYGPSETFYTTYHEIVYSADEDAVPIGKPFSNVKALVLDQKAQLLPIGIVGEIFVVGDSLSSGYLNDEKLTSEKFIDNPYCPGERMYCTGDLGKWRMDGILECLGRIDDQVKVRGYRIELEEVAAALSQCSGVIQTAVAVREDPSGSKQICGYYVGSIAESMDLLHELRNILPIYMVPTQLMKVDAIPITTNGKLNRKALPEPNWGDAGRRNYEPPQGELEEKLAEIWQQVLGVEKVGRNDNFFMLGGHSLKLIKLVNISKKIGVTLTSNLILNNPTLKLLAQNLDKDELSNSFRGEISKASPKILYDLAPQQLRWWEHYLFDMDKTWGNIFHQTKIDIKIDFEYFQESLNLLVSENECLRTIFVMEDNIPKQKILQESKIKINLIDISGLNARDQFDEVTIIRKNHRDHRFDLFKGPLMKVDVCHLAESQSYLFITFHHIIIDGLSIISLIKRLQDFYLFLKEGNIVTINDSSFQYRDYSEWMNNLYETNLIKEQKKYWLSKLNGYSIMDIFGKTEKEQKLADRRGAQINIVINKHILDNVDRLSKRLEVSKFIIYLSCYFKAIFKVSGISDIIVGSPINGREHSELEGKIGFFINLILIRVLLSEEDIEKIIKKVQNSFKGALENQFYQINSIAKDMGLSLEAHRLPFTTLYFSSLDNIVDKEMNIGMMNKIVELDTDVRFDIMSYILNSDKHTILNIKYRYNLYTESEMKHFISEFLECLERLDMAHESAFHDN